MMMVEHSLSLFEVDYFRSCLPPSKSSANSKAHQENCDVLTNDACAKMTEIRPGLNLLRS